MKQLVFAALLLFAFGLFARTLTRYVWIAMQGAKEPVPRLDHLGTRLWNVLKFFFGQARVAQPQLRPATASYHHLVIFWGFLIIALATVETIVSGLWSEFSWALVVGELAARAVKLAVDVASLLVLAALVFAFFRRAVTKPQLIKLSVDAGLILGGIALLVVTYYGHESFGALAAGSAAVPSAPVSTAIARLFAGISPNAAHVLAELAYWVHVVALLAFLNYLPFSKHIHLLGSLPNILMMNLSERKLAMPQLDLEDEKQWGVGAYEQFSWKSLVDTYACTECARCTNYCPAYATGKPLSPMQLVHDIREETLERGSLGFRIERLKRELSLLPPRHHDHHGGAGAGQNRGADSEDKGSHGHEGGGSHESADEEHPDHAAVGRAIARQSSKLEAMPPLIGGRLEEETLWSCTTCGACQQVCPVFVEHPLKILQLRQNLVLAQEKVPADLARAFRNIERNSNPWGIGADQRFDWARDLAVPTLEENPRPEYLLWVGCAGAFDQRIRKQTQALVRLLNAARVSYAVLGDEEACCGDLGRRAGNEMLFQMQAAANIETLANHGITKLVTACPHCLHTFRNDYPQFGGSYEVVHHSQLLCSLVEEGRLCLKKSPARRIVFHDSCYLGRWNGEYDAPRRLLELIPATQTLLEAERRRERGLCCGAGGGRMFLEEAAGSRVNRKRAEDLVASGADTIAVACPFCNIMLADGL
ncbi:MAG: (Fe-S)-binding protein, partial [Pseudomonadota bacterium]